MKLPADLFAAVPSPDDQHSPSLAPARPEQPGQQVFHIPQSDVSGKIFKAQPGHHPDPDNQHERQAPVDNEHRPGHLFEPGGVQNNGNQNQAAGSRGFDDIQQIVNPGIPPHPLYKSK